MAHCISRKLISPVSAAFAFGFLFAGLKKNTAMNKQSHLYTGMSEQPNLAGLLDGFNFKQNASLNPPLCFPFTRLEYDRTNQCPCKGKRRDLAKGGV